ncbi:hypothetical protein [Mycobacterium celatum]|uniref:hypothetical protein n=1 Tax=Mycobacterium celatum TaxID=28045 RepID=UPI0012ECF98B|nr:hypothetical protein [Mycobacterium celatum]
MGAVILGDQLHETPPAAQQRGQFAAAMLGHCAMLDRPVWVTPVAAEHDCRRARAEQPGQRADDCIGAVGPAGVFEVDISPQS